MSSPRLRYLFGGPETPWIPEEWTASDDRVRGGKSISHLDRRGDAAVFHGVLDVTALGGAGFASQHTVDPRTWDLSAYQGLVLDAAAADGKRYVVALKDDVPARRPDGRERSTTSWELAFAGPRGGGTVVLPFSAFEPTYRGRPEPDAEPLDLARVRRISFMMRSFFGEQDGDFSLTVTSLAAVELGDNETALEDDKKASVHSAGVESGKAEAGVQDGIPDRRPWLAWLCGWRP